MKPDPCLLCALFAASALSAQNNVDPATLLMHTAVEPDLHAKGFVDLFNGKDPMFRADTKEDKGGRTRLFGYQSEMDSSDRRWSGGIYGEAMGGWKYPPTRDPGHAAARAAIDDVYGWNRMTIEARGTVMRTWINGVPVAFLENNGRVADFFGLQVHAGMPTHRAASLCDLVAAPTDKPLHPVDAWNTGRIVVRHGHFQHWLDGAKVVDIQYDSSAWKTTFAESKYRREKGFGSRAGPILLQDHGDEVWYRNVRIRQLSPVTPASECVAP